jgi:hypothetical protein
MAQAPETFAWPEGKRVAVSLSFDDARYSQLDAGVPLLDRYGVKGTFYVSFPRAEERAEDWRRAAANGHEIGNHSLKHSCTGNFFWKSRNVLENYTLEDMAAELREATRHIERVLGVSPATFAYPCGQTFVGRGIRRQSYVPAVARQFVAGRGFRDEHFNLPSFCDLAKLGGTELDGLTFEQLVSTVTKGADSGMWIVFAGHDVGNRQLNAGRQVVLADELGRFCEYCLNPENGVWIDTVATIARYVRDRQPRFDQE